jgi:hypothetical protein
MTWPERVFVVVCSLVVLAMIGPISFWPGVLGALVVGLLLWSLLTALTDPPGYRRRRR